MRATDLSTAIGTAVLVLNLAACSAEDALPEEQASSSDALHGGIRSLRANLIDANGASLGSARFEREDGNTEARLRVSGSLTPGFHGMHIHANDNPANGDGCVPPTFVSADAHLNPEGNIHADHAGDMPVLMVLEDGSASLQFQTDRVTLAELVGRVVIIHAAPDNFHNIPVGPNADQYTPNSAAATALTDTTGNAGARVGCGVIND